jgi:hypothetical protein
MGFFGFGNNKKEDNLPKTQVVTSSTEIKTFASNLLDYTKIFQDPYKTSKGYLFGENGTFPMEINHLYNQSPLHSSIINFKTLLTVGNGFTTTDVIKPEEKISLNQLTNQFKNILDEIGMDYYLHSRIGIKVSWNEDHTRIIKLTRLAPVNLRINEVNDDMEPIEFIFSYNFNNSKYPVKKYPVFDILKKDQREQVYYHQRTSPTTNIYSEPTYTSALNWIIMDAEMAEYHRHNIQNSLNPSMLIQIYEKPGTPEEQSMIVNGINQTFGGTNKTGKAMVTFTDGKDLAPSITQMQPNQLDETFLTLTDTIQRQICYAHTINPNLLGLKTPGSLGSSNELGLSYEILLKNQIEPSQKKIEMILNDFLQTNRISSTLTLNTVNIESITPTEEV